ncbi:MAG: hypothetical protein SVS15_07290 [Thermodesulfobacteriota bacterium]|nr:hypothetical protein [Thermodesulfobacteriota bacterium]
MLIDWFTVFAQAVNFLILIFLLHRFLYRPIMKAVRERERKIADRLEDAEKARAEAHARVKELEQENLALIQAKEKLLSEAREEVLKWRDQAVARAEGEIKAKRETWLDGLEGEKAAFSRRLQTRVAEQVLSISQKVLSDMAGRDLEEQLADVFLERVGAEKEELMGEGSGHPDRLLVRLGFVPDNGIQKKLDKRLMEMFPNVNKVEFSVEPELGFGLQLLAADRKVDWNLARYMRGLEESILESLASGSGSPREPKGVGEKA